MRERLHRRFGPNPVFRSRPPFVIWDDRFDFAAARWTAFRRDIYQFQPTLSTLKLVEGMRNEGEDYLESVGFKDFYFILLEPAYRSPNVTQPDNFAAQMRRILERRNVRPVRVIKDLYGRPAFAVFRTDTLQFFKVQPKEAPGSPAG